MSMDIADWLRRIGLEQYTQAFAANDIDGEIVPELTADDLIGLGVTSIGHRRKLLAAIAALRAGVTGGASPLPHPPPHAGEGVWGPRRARVSRGIPWDWQAYVSGVSSRQLSLKRGVPIPP